MKLPNGTTINDKIKGVLASDSRFFLGGIRKILESTGDIQILAEASELSEVEKCLVELKPEFLFLDNRLLKLDITKILSLIVQKRLCLKLILLDDKEHALPSSAGVIKITKETDSSKLIEIIKGKTPQEIALTDSPDSNKIKYELTNMELRVIELIADGFGNRKIANEFSISEKTVKAHLTNIFTKLGLQNRYQLQLMAYTKKIKRKLG